MRILIADDSVVSRHLLEATLRKWGYEVVVATDGLEAWNVLQGENPPRLAILDWVRIQAKAKSAGFLLVAYIASLAAIVRAERMRRVRMEPEIQPILATFDIESCEVGNDGRTDSKK